MKKNDEFELQITGMTAEGSGVGHVDGMAVFAANTAPGDKILAHAIKVKKNYAVAKAMEILTASEDRIEPDCAVFNRCGGCVYRHLSYEAELKIKQQRVADAFERIAGIKAELNPILGSEKTVGYRNKAQLPIGKGKNGETAIGFFSSRTHNIIDSTSCPLQPQKFSEITAAVREWIDENGISVYSETEHKGLLRHIYLRASKNCEQLSVCLVANGNSIPKAEKLWKKIEKLGATGLSININKEKTNVVLGEEIKTLYGSEKITDTLCGCEFEISPHAFYQVNREQAERLYRLAAEYAELNESTTLLDMYCGAGTIGLTMAKKVKSLIGVEIVPDAVENAKKNAAKNGVKNARFICADAAKAAEQLEKEGVRPDVIILDPPRKGCDGELIKTVSQMSPQRVVYVSCDPATLARDCAAFNTLGYKLSKITPVDMFPRTAHVETVVLLGRQKYKSEYEEYFMSRTVKDIMLEYGEQRDEWKPVCRP